MIPKAFQVTMLVLCVRINEHMLIRGVGFSFCMTDGMMLTDIAFQKKKKKTPNDFAQLQEANHETNNYTLAKFF